MDLEERMRSPEAITAAAERFFDVLRTFPKPIVAQVSGPAVGDAFTMLLYCDFVSLPTRALFSVPSVALALTPRFGTGYVMTAAAGYPKAAEKILLSEPISAAEAEAMRLVTAVVEPDDLEMLVASKTARLAVLSARGRRRLEAPPAHGPRRRHRGAVRRRVRSSPNAWRAAKRRKPRPPSSKAASPSSRPKNKHGFVRTHHIGAFMPLWRILRVPVTSASDSEKSPESPGFSASCTALARGLLPLGSKAPNSGPCTAFGSSRIMFKRLSAVLLTAALAAGAVHAAELDGTLKKIRDTNTITIGYRESSVPFSYLNADGKPVGYAFEVCRAVGEAVKTELNLRNLEVRYQAVTSANRVPLIQNGTVDIECGSTTNSLVRQREAAFGLNYFGIQVSAAVKKSSGIKTMKDLDGRNVAVTSGTTSVALLRDFMKKEGVKMRLLMTKDFAEAMQLVVNGRADAFVIDDVLLAGQISNTDNPPTT